VRQEINLLGQPLWGEPFQGLDNTGVQRPLLLMEEAPIGDFALHCLFRRPPTLTLLQIRRYVFDAAYSPHQVPTQAHGCPQECCTEEHHRHR
jgi:hypothetical protein